MLGWRPTYQNSLLMATDASTSNLIELSARVISKTGACARLTDTKAADTKRHRIVHLMEASFQDIRHGKNAFPLASFAFTGPPAISHGFENDALYCDTLLRATLRLGGQDSERRRG